MRVSCTGLLPLVKVQPICAFGVGAAVVGQVERRTQRSAGIACSVGLSSATMGTVGPAVMGTTPIRVALGRCTTTPVAVAICAFGSKALSAGVLGSVGRAKLVVLADIVRRPDLARLLVAELRLREGRRRRHGSPATLHTSVAARVRKVVADPKSPKLHVAIALLLPRPDLGSASSLLMP